MTKGLLHSPFATTELSYIAPRRILLLLASENIPSAARREPCMNAYMNL
jgi:hypothetical protein